ANLWIERRDKLRIRDNANFLIRPYTAKPDHARWRAFIAHLVNIVRGEGLGVVVMDTLPRFWPVEKENDASEVLSAIIPLQDLTATGAATLLLHHPRKSDGEEATAARGSGALAGFADVLVELRRFSPKDRKDRRRVLTAYSRYTATPDELVLELAANGTE